MICSYCGFNCEDGVRFCPSCGNQIVSSEPDFVSVSSMSEIQQPSSFSMEQLQIQADEKTVRRYTGWLVFSLFLALLLIAAAVYLVAFLPEEKEPEVQQETPEIIEEITEPNVGSWANEDGFIIMTASGKFAADDMSGTYSMDDSYIIFHCGDDTVITEYSVSGDILTLTTTRLGEEKSYTFRLVSERTDLSYSQLADIWDEMS